MICMYIYNKILNSIQILDSIKRFTSKFRGIKILDYRIFFINNSINLYIIVKR